MPGNPFLRRAPENFLSQEQVREVRAGRRGFLAGAMAAAAAAAAGAAGPAAAADDPAIVNLPDHSKSLGQGVATRGYGQPS
ncbi:MAG: sulfite dehydrogenase, partial [Burkholderiaceae bacterium]